MTRALVIIMAIALSGCTTLRTRWQESTPMERVIMVGVLGVGIYAGSGVFVGSPRSRECASGTVVTCPPEVDAGAVCTCQ